MKLQNKKIAFFIAETIPSFSGAGRHAFSVAEYLTIKNNQCKIICYNYNSTLKHNETINDIEFHRISYSNKSFIRKIFSVPRLISNYYNEVLLADIICIYGRYLIGYGWIMFFAKIFKKKLIFRSTLLDCDDIQSIKNNSPFLWLFRRQLFSSVRCYWAINDEFGKRWEKIIKTPLNLVITPQGVNTDKFSYEKRKEVIVSNQNPLNIISCGILIERKGYRDIFNVLSKNTNPFNYIIAGQFKPEAAHRSSPVEKKEMSDLYSYGNNILPGKIEFLGTVENIKDYYYKSDILIHGATQEGTPNVILEAMASGLPVICRHLDGLVGKLLIPGKNCLTYNNRDDLKRILEQIDNKSIDLRIIAGNAFETIKNNYSFEKVISQLEQCL